MAAVVQVWTTGLSESHPSAESGIGAREAAALFYLKRLAHRVTFWLRRESKYLSSAQACGAVYSPEG